MFTPETVIHNRYRIVHSIEGAKNETYEAFDTTQQQRVKLQAWATPDSSTLERLRHNANARSRSRHPVLPAVIEHFDAGEQYITVTEWIEGSTLAEQASVKGETFAPAEVLQWAEQLLDGLMILHRQVPVLAHGDIRADNIIITPSGTPKLLGTSLYAVGGTHAPTEEKDIYDTCALIYHLLTGVKAPTMASRSERGFLPTADMLNPAVPPSLGRLLDQGLSAQSEERFKSAFALQNALKRIVEHLNTDETVIAPPPPRTTPSLAAKLQQRQTSVNGDGEGSTPVESLPPASGGEGDVPIADEPAAPATLLESLMAEAPSTEEGTVAESPSDENVPSDAPAVFGFEPQPIAAEAASGESEPEDIPNPAPDPFKLSFESTEPPPYSEAERPTEPPPASEPPPSPPPPAPNNMNRLWFALGLGCLGAIFCVCCGLLGAVVYQWDTFMGEIEASGILDEAPAEDEESNNPFTPDNGTGTNGGDEENGNAGNNEEGITVSVFDIKIGDCFAEPSESESISEITLTDCDDPHDNEVYAFGLYPADEGADFPANEDLEAFADNFCFEEFEEYVGIPYNDSIYYYTYFQPTEMSWEDGDREIVCILYDQDGKMEGSKQNSQE
jgi:serine/threonine protein kinase